MKTKQLSALALTFALGVAASGSTWCAPREEHLAKPTVPKAQVMERDHSRDAATAAKPSAKERTVQRYAQWAKARQEAKAGIPPGSHMTPDVRPGRPLTAKSAMRKYGLPKQPDARETIVIPKGTLLRTNKALGGRPGAGELTSPKTIPPSAIVRVERLPRN